MPNTKTVELQDFIAETPVNGSLTCIFGPTASGKTATAIALAQQHNGIIINADSMQVYKDLRSLSARPSVQEETQAPHRLYGFLDGHEACNASKWAKLAKREIDQAIAVGKHPIVVGGTGLYFRALLEGLSPIPAVDPKVEAKVRGWTSSALDTILAITGETHLQDQQRKKRAVSVYISSGRPLSYWQAIEPSPITLDYRFAVLWPDRAALYEKINLRFERMIREGDALDEIRHLSSLHLPTDLPLMRAIGVPELVAYTKGEIELDAAISAAQQATRRYAKRQFTWMRAEHDKRHADHNFKMVNLADIKRQVTKDQRIPI